MKAYYFAQNTPDWFDIKAAKVTSSRVDDAIAVLKRKEGESARRKNMRNLIVAETLTGIYMGSTFVSTAMEHGADTEPLARTEYELKTGNDVRLVGFVDHPTITRAGASPDGLIGNDGVLEIKCPDTDTHIDYLLARTIPDQYKSQCMWHLACTEREWCDFVSFDPRMTKRHQILVVRMHRDEARIKEMNSAVAKFLEEVDAAVKQIEHGDEHLAIQLQQSIVRVGIDELVP